MGWCSGTEIFDKVAEQLIDKKETSPTKILKALYGVMKDHDWDCEGDSKYYDHPEVKKILQSD